MLFHQSPSLVPAVKEAVGRKVIPADTSNKQTKKSIFRDNHKFIILSLSEIFNWISDMIFLSVAVLTCFLLALPKRLMPEVGASTVTLEAALRICASWVLTVRSSSSPTRSRARPWEQRPWRHVSEERESSSSWPWPGWVSHLQETGEGGREREGGEENF